jgi:hypothetical protein
MPSHHSPAHRTTSLLCAVGTVWLRGFLQESQEIGALLRLLDTGKIHFVAGYKALRVPDPFLKRLGVHAPFEVFVKDRSQQMRLVSGREQRGQLVHSPL